MPDEEMNVLEPTPTPVPTDAPLQGAYEPPVNVMAPEIPAPTKFYGFEDTVGLRTRVFDNVRAAVSTRFPVENERYRIELTDVKYKGPETYSKKQQKEALLRRKSLNRNLYGTWKMYDKATNTPVDEVTSLVAHVPYATERGTFIRDGNEYTIAHQSRLRSGVYTQRRQNGDVQSQFNIQEGGRGFKLSLDPETGSMFMEVGASKLKLFPVLRAIGVDNDTLQDSFGPELYRVNNVIDKSDKTAMEKFDVDRYDGNLRTAIEALKLDPEVTQRTLGVAYNNVNSDVLLAAARRMVDVNRGTAPEDNRDAIHYQQIMSPDQLFAERITRDAQQLVRNKLLWKSTNKGKLAVGPGYLTPQINNVFIRSGLAQPGEEVNPIEITDQLYRVLRTGEGGITSERVTSESRSVQPTHFGVIDPVRSPESGGVGTDNRFTSNVLLGDNGRLYINLRKPKEGETPTPVDIASATNSVIAFPGELKRPGKRVRAMVRGEMGFVDRTEVDYELPHSTAMSTASINLIPGVSGVTGTRALMGAKYFTQALPLQDAEAPWVQAATETDGESFEDRYGIKVGAVRSDLSGRVLSVTASEIKVQTAAGVQTHELYDNFPFNRKTAIHNTTLVQPGDTVKKGQVLASSNFTNAEGVMALGKNLNTAYMVWPGNTDDGVVITETGARKLTSEHMYSKRVDHDTATQRGRKEFMSLYPGEFSSDQMKKLSDNGIVKVGQRVQPGDPLVLAVRERPITDLHKGHKAGWMNATETWDHEADGVITDVDSTAKGVRVSVKSFAPMQIGDKLCYDAETEVLTDKGWKGVADVTTSDRIATLNPDTDQLEYQQPTHTWKFHHEGDMYHLVTKQVDMLVTMDHQIWARRRGEAQYRPITARELYNSTERWYFKKDCKWVGTEQSTFFLPEAKSGKRRNNAKTVSMDVWLRFLGYYTSEGWCCTSVGGGKYVRVAQYRKSKYWEDIRKVLDELGYRYRYSDADGRFEICSAQLYDVLQPLGDSLTKRVPAYVGELSSRQIGLFLETYLNGDGHRGRAWEYCTSSERLAEDIQVLCLKVGWCATVVEQNLRQSNFATHRHWRGRINRSQLRPSWQKARMEKYTSLLEELVQYTGNVYCVTVPNHVIYVKRRRKTYWSLNSGRYG